MKTLTTLLLSCIILLPSAFPQGSLTPPAAPTPTMKTLDQVQPRIPIDAVHTPPSGANAAQDDFTISQPGSYYLTGNIALTKFNGIEVTASGVTIDLNGFQVSGLGSGGGVQSGILIQGVARGCLVKNGTVTNCVFGIICNATTGSPAPAQGSNFAQVSAAGCSSGFSIAADGCSLTNCSAINNTGTGIEIDGGGGTLTNCIARKNGVQGILLGGGATVTGSLVQGCNASNNQGAGIFASQAGGTFVHCAISGNLGTGVNTYGLITGAGSSVIDCTAFKNVGTGISTGNGSTIRNCTASTNTGDGVQAAANCQILGNTCEGNGASGGDGAGVHATGAANRIEANNVTNNTRGIEASTNRNVIVRNTARNNSNNYVVVAGNRVAQIVVPATNAADITGANSGSTDGFTGVDPWANFSY